MNIGTLIAVSYERKNNLPIILKVFNFNNDFYKEDDEYDFLNDLNEEQNLHLDETSIGKAFAALTAIGMCRIKKQDGNFIVIERHIQEI